MSSKDHLNMNLFHGTNAAIPVGGVINPGTDNKYGYGAYATGHLGEARTYALRKAEQQGQLFGTVYRVNPVSDNPTKVTDAPDGYVRDTKGMRVNKAVDYPINMNAVPSASDLPYDNSNSVV
jgi:hypothetical protein